MLLIDGVKYRLWTPKNEEKEFHPMIKEHSKEIFGEDSIYFDIKHKLESRAGIVSIPDAYVINLSKPYRWFIVENELSSHPVYEHIVPQLTKFSQGIKNPQSQKQIVKALHKEVTRDPFLRLLVERSIASKETYLFLSELISQPPKIAIIAEEMTDEIKEACDSFPNVQYMEFKTFVREDAENIRAHLFTPLIPSILEEEARISLSEEEVETIFPEFIKKLYPAYARNHHSAAMLTVLHEKHKGKAKAVESWELAKEMKLRFPKLFGNVQTNKISYGNIFAGTHLKKRGLIEIELKEEEGWKYRLYWV